MTRFLTNKFASLVALCLLAMTAIANAQNMESKPHAGMWHFHSAKGYQGYVLMDGMGGCSYFLSSAVLTIQATCIDRPVGNDLIIYGTQEGINAQAPSYGDQLANPALSSQVNANPTVVTFHISEMSNTGMRGHLITAGGRETVSFTR